MYFLIEASKRSEQNFKNLREDDEHVKKPQTFRQLSQKSEETSETLLEIKKEMINLRSWTLKEVTSQQTEILEILSAIRSYNSEIEKIHASQEALNKWKEKTNERYEKQVKKLTNQQAQLRDIKRALNMQQRLVEAISSSETSTFTFEYKLNRFTYCLVFHYVFVKVFL